MIGTDHQSGPESGATEELPSKARAVRAMILGIASLTSYRIMPVLLILGSFPIRLLGGVDLRSSNTQTLDVAVYIVIGVGLLTLIWALVNTIRNRKFMKAGTPHRGFFVTALVCTSVATLEVLGYGAIWAFFSLSPGPATD